MTIEDGTYEAKPLPGALLGVTGKGTECVGVEFEFVGDEGNKHRISWYGYFSEKTVERTIEALRFCGWTGNDLSDLSEIGGRDDVRVNLVIQNEEYEGKVRAKVQWVNRAGGIAMANPLDADQRKSFAARMKGSILAFDQKSGAPRNNVKQAPIPSERVSDDIPF
jgi:hypothetical protein